MVRGDLTEVVNIMKGFNDVNSGNLFSLSDLNYGSHSLKLYKPRCHLNECKLNILTEYVLDIWNVFGLRLSIFVLAGVTVTRIHCIQENLLEISFVAIASLNGSL